MKVSKTRRVWTVAEAKAKLSEILRLAETSEWSRGWIVSTERSVSP